MRALLYTAPKCAAGSTYLGEFAEIIDYELTRSVDNNDSLTLTVASDEPLLGGSRPARLRDVLHMIDQLADGSERVFEFRVSRINDAFAAAGVVSLSGLPLVVDLTTCGLLRHLNAGRLNYNGGLDNATPSHYIDTFILPFLDDLGIDWITRGNIDFDARRYTFAWKNWTPRQLARTLEEKTSGEFELRRNGDTDYKLDIVIARNSDKPAIRVRTDKQLQAVDRERWVEPLKTVMIPFGLVPDGDAESATIGYFVAEITAISTNTLTIADPNGLGDLIRFNDQYGGAGIPELPNRYLLKPAGTLTEITDTIEATQQVVVADATGLAIGDHVEIRANSAGDLLTELANPANLDDFGRLEGFVEDTDMRGERNHLVVNLLKSTHFPQSKSDAFRATFNGVHSATTTWNLTGLASFNGTVFSTGDWVFITSGWFRVVTGGTVVGGNVSLVTSQTVSMSGGEEVIIVRRELPTGWVKFINGITGDVVPHWRVDSTLFTELTPTVNGAHTSQRKIALSGLTGGQLINAGSRFLNGSNVATVLGRAQADGSGNVDIIVDIAQTLTNGQSVTITPPHVRNDGGPAFLRMPGKDQGAYGETAPFYVRADDNSPLFWAQAAITIYNHETTAIATKVSPATGEVGVPELEIIKVSDGSVLASMVDKEITIGANSYAERTLQLAHQLTATTQVKIRVKNVYRGGSAASPQQYGIDFVWAMGHLGSDPAAPPVHGAHANDLLHLGLNALVDSSPEPLTMTATLDDLAHSNEDILNEALDAGISAKLHAEGMAGNTTIDVDTRIMAVTFRKDRRRTEVTFGTIPPRVTEALAKSQGASKRLALQINVGDDAGSVGTTSTVVTYTDSGEVVGNLKSGEATTDEPFAKNGALRGAPPPGDTSTDGPLPIRRYSKGNQ